MTGWLAATGIALVLLASLYTGLASTTANTSDLRESLAPTATARAEEAETPVPEPAGEAAQQPENSTSEDGAREPQGAPADGDGSNNEAAATPQSQDSGAPTQVFNRQDCEKIRGTQYHSPEERTWYLGNCVRR